MNRIIKFRAWDKVDNLLLDCVEINFHKKWVALVYNNGEGGELQQRKFEDIDLMQFTGLLDKNGKEIYEGDVCIHQQVAGGLLPPNPAKNVQIMWTELHNGWICDDGKYRYSMQSPQLEIIGNVFENQEFLTPNLIK